MSKRKSYHVTHRADGNWQTKAAGASRASGVHPTKAQAVQQARDLAKTTPQGQVVIHRKDDSIQTEHTYGADPYPPKG